MEDAASHETAYKLAHRADKANPWSDLYPTPGRIIIQSLVGSDLCNLSNCTETQKVQFQALALRAGDFDLLSSSDRVWGKSGFRSIPNLRPGGSVL
jgi:hypothetical protein